MVQIWHSLSHSVEQQCHVNALDATTKCHLSFWKPNHITNLTTHCLEQPQLIGCKFTNTYYYVYEYESLLSSSTQKIVRRKKIQKTNKIVKMSSKYYLSYQKTPCQASPPNFTTIIIFISFIYVVAPHTVCGFFPEMLMLCVVVYCFLYHKWNASSF